MSNLSPETPNTHQGEAVEAATYHDTAREALNEALFFYNQLPNYSKTTLDYRLYAVIVLKRISSYHELFSSIAEREDCDDATRAEALDMRDTLQARLDMESVDYAPTIANIDHSIYTTSEVGSDLRDYENTIAFSATLFDEQYPASGTLKDVLKAIEPDLIIELCAQREALAYADHDIPALDDQYKAYNDLMSSLDAMHKRISTREDLPVANAATLTLLAKTRHSTTEQTDKSKRDPATLRAIIDLWSARRLLEPVEHKNAVIEGMMADVDRFIKIYSAEIRIDPHHDPASTAGADEEIEKWREQARNAADSISNY